MTIKKIRLIIMLCLSLAVPACGGSAASGPEESVLKAAEAAYYRQDFATAARGFELLANRGNARAEFFLGELYLSGRGVKQDDAMALKLERSAAEKGSEAAQYTLGGMYEAGQGVPKDVVQAHVWYSLSASTGDEQAIRKKAALETAMSASQLEESRQREQAWIKAHQK
jgi:TPR repeat protein